MATKEMTFNDKPLYFVQRYTTKQFSFWCFLKQRGDGMKRFGDMKGNYEPFNKFYVWHVLYVYEEVEERHGTADW